MAERGRLVILSGPSGVGKDTVIDRWRAVNPYVKRVVAYTTRSPRQGETNGTDYHYVSVARFLQLVEEGAFLEHKEVHGNYYATPLHDMEGMLEAGQIAILKIDVQGALAVMKLRSDATTIFLLPPSTEELERRIRSRGTDDHSVIEKRLKNAREEIALADRYQRRIVNDDIERVIAELQEIAGG